VAPLTLQLAWKIGTTSCENETLGALPDEVPELEPDEVPELEPDEVPEPPPFPVESPDEQPLTKVSEAKDASKVN